VGREKEVEWAEMNLEEVGSRVIICGPSGIGKSCLALFVAKRIERKEDSTLIM